MAENDIYQLTVHTDTHEGDATNVFYYRESSTLGVDGMQCQEVVDSFENEVIPLWQAWTASHLYFGKLYCTKIYIDRLQPPRQSVLANTFGDQPGSALPSDCSLVVNTYAPGGIGKQGYGRWYFNGIPDVETNKNKVSDGLAPVIQPFIEALVNPLNSGALYGSGLYYPSGVSGDNFRDLSEAWSSGFFRTRRTRETLNTATRV